MPVERIGHCTGQNYLLQEGRGCFPELDCDPLCLLIDPVNDELGGRRVPSVGIQKNEATEAVLDQALRGFEKDFLDSLRLERDGTREGHVVGRIAGKKDRRDQNVRALRNQLRLFDSIEIVRA